MVKCKNDGSIMPLVQVIEKTFKWYYLHVCPLCKSTKLTNRLIRGHALKEEGYQKGLAI